MSDVIEDQNKDKGGILFEVVVAFGAQTSLISL